MGGATKGQGRSGPRPPGIVEATLAGVDLRPDADGRYEQVRVAEGDWSGADAEFVEFEESVIAGVRSDGANLRRLQLADVRVEASDWSNTRAADATFVRVEFVRCKLLGIDLGGASLQDVRFVDCDLRLSSLRYAKLRRVAFADCNLRQSTLQGAELRDCALGGCELAEAQLSHSTHEDTDLRGSKLEGLLGLEYLRGAVIDPNQLIDLAPAMAAALGLRVDA